MTEQTSHPCTIYSNIFSNKKQEGFIWCPIPTYILRQKDEEWRMESEGWKLNDEGWMMKSKGGLGAGEKPFSTNLRQIRKTNSF